MMKKLLALFVAVVAAICVTASVAVADPGNGVATAQFTVQYTYGPTTVTCKGQRIVTTGPNASVRDRETCEVSDQSLLAEGTTSLDAPFSWYSDYEAFVLTPSSVVWAVSGTLVVKNRPNGTQIWQVHATY